MIYAAPCQSENSGVFRLIETDDGKRAEGSDLAQISDRLSLQRRLP